MIIKNRFVKGCLKYVSRLYYVGSEARKAVEVLEDIDPDLIKITDGQEDIWKDFHHIWNDQIKT